MDRKDCLFIQSGSDPYVHRSIEGYLTHSYLSIVELGKPYVFLKGRTIVRKSQYTEGKGLWRKRKPTDESQGETNNLLDRSSKFALVRKDADFHMVVNTKENGK